MRLPRLVATLLVLVFLSGCADWRGRLEADPVPTYARVVPWTLDGCQFAVAVMPVPPASLGERTPPGFRILSVYEIPGFPIQRPPAVPTDDPRGGGNLGIELFRCASGSGLNATDNLTEVSYGSIFSFVEAPEDQREEVTFHFLKWDVLVNDAARRDLLRAERVPAFEGNATFSQFTDVGPVKLVQGLLQLGDASYAFESGNQPQGTDAFAAISFLEFSEAREDTFAEWRTNVTTTQVLAGSGFLDLADAADWVKAAAGADRVQAYYITGQGAFENGTISFPYHDE